MQTWNRKQLQELKTRDAIDASGPRISAVSGASFDDMNGTSADDVYQPADSIRDVTCDKLRCAWQVQAKWNAIKNADSCCQGRRRSMSYLHRNPRHASDNFYFDRLTDVIFLSCRLHARVQSRFSADEKIWRRQRLPLCLWGMRTPRDVIHIHTTTRRNALSRSIVQAANWVAVWNFTRSLAFIADDPQVCTCLQSKKSEESFIDIGYSRLIPSDHLSSPGRRLLRSARECNATRQHGC